VAMFCLWWAIFVDGTIRPAPAAFAPVPAAFAPAVAPSLTA
jgi:hypothetical protein